MFLQTALAVLLTLIAITFSLTAVVNGQRQAQCCEEYCYELDHERTQSSHFGSKTSYLIAKGSETGRQFLVPNCNPVKIWLYSRHGTRLPEAKAIERLKELEYLRDEIIDNYEKRRSKPDIGALCERDLDLLRRWRWDKNITVDYSDFLTTPGWDELKFLAIRYQRAFPNIMENIYDRQKFQFRYTKTQRTEASFKAFVEGLFGPNAHEHVHVPQPPINDTLLRPYQSCPVYKENKSKNKADGSEYMKFQESQIYTQLISDVSSRLGYKFPLKSQQIYDIFEMCRYDQAWNLEKPSPWCAAFTPNQVNVLEYLLDLETYYKSGYSHDMNSRVACAAVTDMLHHMESNELPKVVSYFSHLDGILTLLTTLGAAKDSDSLRADNYYSQSRRKWRTSELGPFAANLAVIKYECPNENERAKMMFFLNEKPLDFSWCKVGLCSLSDVKEMYKEFRQGNCDTYFCSSSASSLQLKIGSGLMPLISLLGLLKSWY